MIELNTRVKHPVKGWFGKTLKYVTADGLIQVEIENGGKVSIRDSELEVASPDENNARLYKEMVTLFLKAAERRLVKDWKEGLVPQFGDGDPYNINYGSSFDPATMRQIALALGITLPKVSLIEMALK